MRVVGQNNSEATATRLKYCRRNCLIVHDNGVGVFKCFFFIGFITYKMHLIKASHIVSDWDLPIMLPLFNNSFCIKKIHQ